MEHPQVEMEEDLVRRSVLRTQEQQLIKKLAAQIVVQEETSSKRSIRS